MRVFRRVTVFGFAAAFLLMGTHCSNFGREVNNVEKPMIFEKLEVGPLGVNCFVLGCPTTREGVVVDPGGCLLYTSPSPRDGLLSRMPSSA